MPSLSRSRVRSSCSSGNHFSHVKWWTVPSRSVTVNFRWTFLRARHVTLPILRWCCTPCVVAVTSRCTSVCVSAPAHFFSGCSSLCVSSTHCCFCWTKRKQRTPFNISISIDELGFDTVTRVNIPLRSFREMVRQGTGMRWIATAQLSSLLFRNRS